MLRRHWLTLVTCAALLVVPLLGLLLFPATPRPTASPRPAATAAAVTETEPTPDRPRRRPAAGTPIPGGDDDDEDPRPAAEPATEAIRGVVVDAEGQPVAGATVRCTDRQARIAVSDPAGQLELPDDTDGCAATAQDGVHSVSPPVTIRATSDNRFVMGRAGGIAGAVLDEGGKPVPSYVIAIESFSAPGGDGPGPSGAPRSIQDAAGGFEWADIPAGRYVLTASTDGRPPARSDSIQVDAGSVTRNVRLVLPSGATFRGKVVDAETRKPVAGATFALDTATTTGANAIGSADSDATGNFVLSGVPSRGLFSVRVTHAGYRTKIRSGLDTRGSPTLTETVQLSPRGDGGGDSELAGIGAYLIPAAGGVAVMGLVPGGPAEKGGMRRGDRVDRIDGGDARAMPLAEAVQRLRGPEGSRLAVRVDRGGQMIDLNIVRAIVVR
ncbi:MAG: carboxypeptidase regulatory-like domain-containing protein [Polyangiaceae bacterium]